MLLPLVNKGTALGLVIGQNLGRWEDRTKCWEEEQTEPWRCQVKHAESFLVSHEFMGEIQINRNGLIQDVRVSQ